MRSCRYAGSMAEDYKRAMHEMEFDGEHIASRGVILASLVIGSMCLTMSSGDLSRNPTPTSLSRSKAGRWVNEMC